MLNSGQVQTIRTTLRSFLAQFHCSSKPMPFDHDLFQACIDEGIRRGYQMDGIHSVRTYMEVGVGYGMTAGAHLNGPTKVWLSLLTSCVGYIDEVPIRHRSEIPSIYLFHERFTKAQKQDNAVLDAFADLIHQAAVLYSPIPAKLMMTSLLNFVTANLVETETVSMQVTSVAGQFPVYYREMSAVAEGYAYMVFSPEIPYTEYFQAIPYIMLLLGDVNDVLSFYKEELAGEGSTQVCVMARRDKGPRLDAFNTLAEIAIGHYEKIVKILEGSPNASEEFKHFTVNYIGFHILLEARYKLADLEL